MSPDSALIICPYLRGGHTGAFCTVRDDLIRNIEGVDIRLCMSRRHEACYVYFSALATGFDPTLPEASLETAR